MLSTVLVVVLSNFAVLSTVETAQVHVFTLFLYGFIKGGGRDRKNMIVPGINAPRGWVDHLTLSLS